MSGARPGPEDGGLLAALKRAGPEGVECGEVMVVVAHADDETIGIGGQLSRLGRVRIVHVTDGAPADMQDATAHGFSTREAYAAARRGELETAMSLAGVPPERLLAVGIADQAASRQLARLAREMVRFVAEFRPSTVVTHAYEGGHPDHDATAYAVHAARHILSRAGAEAPEVVEMPLYHARGGRMVAQEFAPARPGDPAVPETALRLTGPAWELKRRMLAAHATQQRTLAPFTSPVERFRPAPAYHFGALPNGGEVLYDRLPWGTTGAEWRDLVEEARRELGLPRWL